MNIGCIFEHGAYGCTFDSSRSKKGVVIFYLPYVFAEVCTIFVMSFCERCFISKTSSLEIVGCQ